MVCGYRVIGKNSIFSKSILVSILQFLKDSDSFTLRVNCPYLSTLTISVSIHIFHFGAHTHTHICDYVSWKSGKRFMEKKVKCFMKKERENLS